MDQEEHTSFGVFKPVGHTVISFPSADQAAACVKALGAERAQLYGHFIIEELITHADAPPQVAESPDRKLDSATPSGREEERAEPRPAKAARQDPRSA